MEKGPLERAALALAGWTPNARRWEDICDERKDAQLLRARYRDQVRAVLRAIREPSEAMKDAGGFLCSPCSDNPTRWKVLNKAERQFSEEYATDVWQTMVDKALAE